MIIFLALPLGAQISGPQAKPTDVATILGATADSVYGWHKANIRRSDGKIAATLACNGSASTLILGFHTNPPKQIIDPFAKVFLDDKLIRKDAPIIPIDDASTAFGIVFSDQLY